MPAEADYLGARIMEVRLAIKELERLTLKPYTEMSPDEIYSMRYHVVVLAEALGAICLHLAVEELKVEPASYSECFKLLEERGLLKGLRELTKLMGLRNLLVHRYWTIDDAKINNEIRGNFGQVERLMKEIERRYGLDTSPA